MYNHDIGKNMILFSDFDNTLSFMNEEWKTRKNLEAIKKWRSAGNQFCITTGRSYRSVTEQLPEIKELCDYYIVDSGSIILSKNNELIKAFYFEPAVVTGIINYSKNFSEVPVAYYYVPGSEDADYKTENVTKLRLWFKDTNLLNQAAEEIRKNFPVFAFTLAIGMPTHPALIGKNGFVEIIPIGFGKSNAIKQLIQEETISPEEVITVGDGFNDFEMIRDFDGYVIANSELARTYKELKATSSISSLVEFLLQ